MTQKMLVAALNEWMRRVTKSPHKFRREFEDVAEFLSDKAAGREPSYGQIGAAYMLKLSKELSRRQAQHPGRRK